MCFELDVIFFVKHEIKIFNEKRAEGVKRDATMDMSTLQCRVQAFVKGEELFCFVKLGFFIQFNL